MRVLYATPFVPWPLDSGGRLRAYHLARAAAERAPVELHAVAEPRDLSAAREALEPCFERVVFHERTPGTTLAHLLRAKPERWFRSDGLADHLRERGDESFVLHLEEVFLARQVPAELRARTLVGHQKIDSVFHAEARERASVAARVETLRLANLEAFAARHFPHHLCCSEGDAENLARRFPGLRPAVIASGFDPDHFSPVHGGAPRAGGPLLLLGSLDYEPNVDAAEFLVREVLPLVRERQPRARVQLVGRRPSDRVRALAGDAVELHADVPDVRPFLEAAAALVVPLRIGGGTRLKIVEALASACPVISTPIGAEGLALEGDVHLTLAEGARALAAAAVHHLDDPAQAARLAAAGRDRVHDRYTWNRLAEGLIDLWRPLEPS